MGVFLFQEIAKDYTFVIFVVLLTGFTVLTYFYVPETKNKTFEEIAHQFSPGDQLEVEEMEELDDIPPMDLSKEDLDNELVTLNFEKKE